MTDYVSKAVCVVILGIVYTVIEETELEKERYSMQQTPRDTAEGSTLSPRDSTATQHILHRRILLNNTVLSGNTLGQVGPIILLFHLNDIQICCGPWSSCKTGKELEGPICLDGDMEKQGNRLLGTFLEGLNVSPNQIDSDHEYASGTALPVFTITLLDAFGNMANAKAMLEVSSSDGTVGLLGPISSGVPISCTANVTGIRLYGEPGTHHLELTVTPTQGGTRTVVATVSVVVRKCRIGEQAVNHNTECRKCDDYFYNFDPDRSNCTPCLQDKTQCNGKALAPLDGYWHNSSHSDVIVKCLNENACSYQDRTDELMRRAGKNTTVNLTWKDNYPLCQKVCMQIRILQY